MRAVVVGGMSGIGKATAERLWGEYQIPVTTVGKENYDVRHADDMMELAEEHRDAELWVFSAGVNYLSPIEALDFDLMREQYETNVMGFLRLMAYLRDLRGTDATSVVAVGSDAAERPMRTSSVYCGTKAALHQTVRCLARELAPHWRVNAVAPGMTEHTKMQEYIDATVPTLRGWTPEQAMEYELSQVPFGRRGTTGEVAEVVTSVLLGADYLTGSIVTVNGGR